MSEPSQIIGFIRGPSFVLATAADDRATRWCFRCRQHLLHTWELLDEPPERHPTPYEAIPICRCTRCGEDHTDHPGAQRDGPHYPESQKICDVLAAAAQVTLNSESYKAALFAAMDRWRDQNVRAHGEMRARA